MKVNILLNALILLLIFPEKAILENKNVNFVNLDNNKLSIINIKSFENGLIHKLKIENKTNNHIIDFLIVGFFYDKNYKIIGGFSKKVNALYKPGDKKELDLDLKEIYKVKDKNIYSEEKFLLAKYDILIIIITKVCMLEKDRRKFCWSLQPIDLVKIKPFNLIYKEVNLKRNIEDEINNQQCLAKQNNLNITKDKCDFCKECLTYAYECKKVNDRLENNKQVKYTCICSENICNYICK